jgi:uncharacterized membrane protein
MESNPPVSPETSSEQPKEQPGESRVSSPLAAEKATELLRTIAPAELAAEARTTRVPGAATPQQTRSLNDAVHEILIIGLGISTVLLVTGLILELLTRGALPEVTLDPVEAFRQTLQLRSLGFLSLGLLVLMITPIVRVIGSMVVFIWERDRRYTLITLAVLVVMTASLLLGRG